MKVAVQLTVAAWLGPEAGLLFRDRVRGKDGTTRDQGTLWLNIIITAAVVAAGTLTGVVKNAAASQFEPAGPSVAGIR